MLTACRTYPFSASVVLDEEVALDPFFEYLAGRWAGAFGRVQRALLVADDADHRVAGLALVRREHPRLREVLDEVLVAVAMG